MFLIASEAIPAMLAILTMGAAIVTVVSSWKMRREKQLQAAANELAQDLGLTLIPKDSLGLGKQLQEFDLFSRERSTWFRNTSITNILRGQVEDTEVYMFDYTYVVSTGKSSRRVSQTVFFANDKEWYLPEFQIKPETWWHKVLKKIGLDDEVKFPDTEDFSEKFWVTTDFAQLIREKFTPAIREFLTERPPVHIEGSNYYLIAYKPNKVLSPDEARVYFKHCCDLVVMLKKEGKTELLDLAEWRKEKAVAPPVEIRKS